MFIDDCMNRNFIEQSAEHKIKMKIEFALQLVLMAWNTYTTTE